MSAAPMTGVRASWRVASLTVTAAAVALGVALVVFLPFLALVALCAAFAVVTFALVPASRRPPLVPLDDEAIRALGELPVVTVLVAGRDEALVLPHLLADLAAQDHRDADGTPRFEIIVIDDRSDDGTGAVAVSAARREGIGAITRVVRRGPAPGAPATPADAQLPDGKGAALSATSPLDYRGEVVAVLDADARIGPDYLRRAASYFARGAGAMTARKRTLKHHPAGWLARQLEGAQADEQTADGEIQRGRWSQGGCSEFRGNGILVRRDLLEAVGGWHPHALTEDLDLSTRLAILGERVGWALDAVAWEEPVPGMSALRRQRLRWGEGIVRRELELTLPLLASRRLGVRAKLDYLAYSGQTVLPVSILAALVAGAIAGAWPSVLVLFATYLGPGAILTADSLRWEGLRGAGTLRARLLRGLRLLVFSGLWIPVFVICWPRVALGGGPLRYEKTEHLGAPEGFCPGEAGEAGKPPAHAGPGRAARRQASSSRDRWRSNPRPPCA